MDELLNEFRELMALYGWLTWQVARPIVTEWKQKRIYLWPFWTSSGKPA